MSDRVMSLEPALGELTLVDRDAAAKALGLRSVRVGGVPRYYRDPRFGPYLDVGFVNSVEAALLDHFWTDPAYTPPATLYLALSTTTPTEAGANFTEPATGSYARVATAAAQMSAAAAGDPATKSNTGALAFPTATATWSAGSNMTYWGLFDASSAGNLLWFALLTTAKPVNNGDTAQFAAAAMIAKLGDPADSY